MHNMFVGPEIWGERGISGSDTIGPRDDCWLFVSGWRPYLKAKAHAAYLEPALIDIFSLTSDSGGKEPRDLRLLAVCRRLAYRT